jgi:hypothetical protein
MALSKKQQALVDEFEHRHQMCVEFMNDWLLFNQILTAYPSPGVNKAQLENQFLKIKSKLAREHKVLKDTLQTDYHIDGNAMNIISSATSLEAIYSQSEVAVKKLQNEWHRAFISVNETLGGLEDKRNRAQHGEKIWLPPPGGGAGEGGGGGRRGGGGMSPAAKKNIMILLIVLVVLGIMLGVPQIRNLYVSSFNSFFGGR